MEYIEELADGLGINLEQSEEMLAFLVSNIVETKSRKEEFSSQRDMLVIELEIVLSVLVPK